jgi:hypothetical protein
MEAKSESKRVVKAIFLILGIFVLIPFAAMITLQIGAGKSAQEVYRLHFTAPIDTVRIIDGGGITWQGGQHYLRFSTLEPVAVKHRDLFAEIPLASKAAQDGIKHLTAKFPEDRGLFAAGDDLKCLYLSNPGGHNEKWLFSQRSRPVHFFCSITK